MKSLFKITLFTASLCLANSALARNDISTLAISDALNQPAAKEKVDTSIKLYFGNQNHPKVAKDLGEFKTNKKTNGFNKSDQEACNWTFLSAIIELQERAKKEGGNAVINIKSNYKNVEHSSETEFTCGSGALMSGVALKGTVVKLAE